VHYAPVAKAVFDTDIARLREVTDEGRAFLARAPDFCRLERTLVARLLAGKLISKPVMMAEFNFPGRIFNAAYDSAKGLIDSAKACAVLALETTTGKLYQAMTHYAEAEADPARQGELHGRRQRIARLVEQEARHEQLVSRPKIFFGGALYRKQHKQAGWKPAYHAKRNDHISANGGADEAAGNMTLRVTLGSTEMIGDRLWQGFDLVHSRKRLGRFRFWAAECEDLVRAVQANAGKTTTRLVEVWFDETGKKISDFNRAKMEKAGLRPAEIRQIERVVTDGRVGLTIDLRRQVNGKWYIHISRQQKLAALASDFATPAGWIGVDLNCDSIAHGVVSIRDGEPVLESYAKDYFPPTGPAGERLTALYTIVNAIVAEAAERRLGICLEYLDFEHCKRFLRNKLGALLHLMPYRTIRGIFERRCLEAGVPLRYVPPKYSSLLGALISVKWPQLGRDQAAGAVLALRASEAGNQWLELACEQAAKAEQVSFRLNAKGKYGHTLLVADTCLQPADTGFISWRQTDSPRYPVEPALKWQVACGRKVSRAFSTLADLRSASLRAVRRAAKAPKRSSVRPRFKMPALIKLEPEEPHQVSPCSSLSNAA